MRILLLYLFTTIVAYSDENLTIKNINSLRDILKNNKNYKLLLEFEELDNDDSDLFSTQDNGVDITLKVIESDKNEIIVKLDKKVNELSLLPTSGLIEPNTYLSAKVKNGTITLPNVTYSVSKAAKNFKEGDIVEIGFNAHLFSASFRRTIIVNEQGQTDCYPYFKFENMTYFIKKVENNK